MLIDFEYKDFRKMKGTFSFCAKQDYVCYANDGSKFKIQKERIMPAYYLALIDGRDVPIYKQKQPYIYFLFLRQKLVYVGVSFGNVMQRLHSHMNDEVKMFNSFAVLRCSSQNVMFDLEADIIKHEQPIYNIKQHRQIKLSN